MKLLLIDTCGITGSVALADTTLSTPIIATSALPGRTSSERLVATIRDLSASSNLSLPSLDAIVVVSGPGSFTGVRVGLSAAKGLCEALSLPLIAISRLAVLAHSAAVPKDAAAFALLNAGRSQLYLGIYRNGLLSNEALVTRDELFAATKQTGDAPAVIITCEAAIAESIANLNPQLLPEPTAQDVLPLAIRRLEARDFDDIATLDANYLRRTDAEIFAKPARVAASMP
jgi:tRNA threonylcarbamoyladenosine biosynthesis protein TsaB